MSGWADGEPARGPACHHWSRACARRARCGGRLRHRLDPPLYRRRDLRRQPEFDQRGRRGRDRVRRSWRLDHPAGRQYRTRRRLDPASPIGRSGLRDPLRQAADRARSCRRAVVPGHRRRGGHRGRPGRARRGRRAALRRRPGVAGLSDRRRHDRDQRGRDPHDQVRADQSAGRRADGRARRRERRRGHVRAHRR